MTTLATAAPAGTWQIETSHSHASFAVRHAGISKVRGSVAIVEGTVLLTEDVTGSSVSATLDPATIDTRDAKRDGHLRSADFFDTEQFPTWTFTSTSVEEGGSGLLVHGDLTLHGVTRRATLDVELNGAATDPFGTSRVGFSATTRINRKDFGLTWNAALETGGVLVSEMVDISLEIEGVKAD
ncbi:YceI family protein [Isoptericola sp. b441]|uniref:YceI family protein n=1 Tax=Actinotalea lenta TaxID=3064654 RepID=A0ABT9D6M6_9CELL|nr:MULTISPECIES: YceI family protein [unclassified Isoptericola]MDO8106489.1 YceI family protein [Isoptericola sp. b441]MDO8121795.1 YceI family protein [Isoptericola sp. b490]